MSVARISPTANLLRTSRLFALPSPLPKPTSASTATSHYDSDTATTPYPTNAAIETSDTSLGRGDWGLKRALPLKSTTRSSSPTIHVDNLDSIDHITDFGSAADHTRTLQKWQEMDLSMSASGPNAKESLVSVFDSSLDNIQIKTRTGRKNQGRWKFKGPWLAGQSNGQFSEYASKTMHDRKLAFRRYLSDRLAKTNDSIRRRESIESGEIPESMGKGQITEAELDRFVKHLRKSAQGSLTTKSELDNLIEDFLDLPIDTRTQKASEVAPSIDRKGPPSTHPSGGLSYLRSHAHTYNHPIHGPQEEKPPVEARVLIPQFREGRRKAKAILGVGGIVAGDERFTFAHKDEPKDIAGFDPDLPGGGKVWVQPKHASIDSRGHIEFSTKRADKNALNVLRGESESEIALPPAALNVAKERNTPILTTPQPTKSATSQAYGFEEGSASNSGRAQPFDGQDSLPSLLQILK